MDLGFQVLGEHPLRVQRARLRGLRLHVNECAPNGCASRPLRRQTSAARAVCPARLVRHARYASEDTRPRTRAQRARAEPERAEVGQARLWDLMEKNAQIFHPKMLPKILVPAAALSPSEQQDVRLVQLLQRAMKYLERDGPLVPVVGAKGACSIVKASRQLHTPEARSFSLKWLGVMCAQAPSLDASLLAELAQELLRFKILDEEIWEALARTVCERCDGLGAAEVVPLLDAFKRSYTSSKVDRAIVALCQRATDCCEEFSQRQCVVAVASLCRLSRAVPATLLDQVIHRLLETWLARVDAFSRQTNVNQVISLAISLTALPTNSPVRARQLAGARGALPTGSVEIFQHRLAGWAHDCGAPGVGVLSPEELILVLWALKDLTPTGLEAYGPSDRKRPPYIDALFQCSQKVQNQPERCWLNLRFKMEVECSLSVFWLGWKGLFAREHA